MTDTPSIKVIDRDTGKVLHEVPLIEQDQDGNWYAAEAMQQAIDWAAAYSEIGPKIEPPDASA